ncbi:MAG: hypothetical protein N3B13_03640 [Deltaproteobacteria bacterium]|nr:hypothetical protein [Deltaproteobacteria bacterium]
MMLRNYSSPNNTVDNKKFNTVFPGRYLYFDKYAEKLFNNNKPFSVTFSLFDGRIRLSITTKEQKIVLTGDRELSDEVIRHLSKFPAIRNYSVEVI